MKIFLDFDDVVFNTKQFNIDRRDIFQKHGIVEKDFNQYFEEFKANRKKGELIRYNQDKHIESLEKMFGNNNIDFEGLRKELSEFIKGAKKYVFKEFYEFAEKIGRDNLYILSYGDIKYQTEKIKNSEVEEYFNEMIITDGKKSEAIEQMFKKYEDEFVVTEKVYFVDDRIVHLEDVRKKIPGIKTLLMASGNGRHNDEIEDKTRLEECCDGVVGNFVEIEKLLEQNGELKQEFCCELKNA